MTVPRSRNSVDWLVGVNTQSGANITGAALHNGQAAFWYSQGCAYPPLTPPNPSVRQQDEGRRGTFIVRARAATTRPVAPLATEEFAAHPCVH